MTKKHWPSFYPLGGRKISYRSTIKPKRLPVGSKLADRATRRNAARAARTLGMWRTLGVRATILDRGVQIGTQVVCWPPEHVQIGRAAK